MKRYSVTNLMVVSITTLYFIFDSNKESYFYKFALIKESINQPSDYYRFISVIILHGNITHLLFNMLALYQLGNIIERRVGIVKFIKLTLLTTISASLTSYAFMDQLGASIGASGLVFGLLGYFYMIYKEYNVSRISIYVTIVLNMTLPFFVDNIDYKAHIGGFIAGIILKNIFEDKNNLKN
jgi:rhomboid protease GluP